MLVASVMLFSCKTNKENNLAYFHNLNDIPSGVLPNPQSSYPIVVQPDDELIVAVTSAVPEATAAYNLPLENPATRNALRMATQPRTQTYIVDEQGYIMMPVLGRLQVGGKTIPEISNMITNLVGQDVKDPFVRVDIVNFSIDVLGEVHNPHRVSPVSSIIPYWMPLPPVATSPSMASVTASMSSAPKTASATTSNSTSIAAKCSTRPTFTCDRMMSCMLSPTRSASTTRNTTKTTPSNSRSSRPS